MYVNIMENGRNGKNYDFLKQKIDFLTKNLKKNIN